MIPPPPSAVAPHPARVRGRAVLLLLLLTGLVALAGIVGGPPEVAAAAPVAPLGCEASPAAVRAGATLGVVVDFGGGRVRVRCTEPGGSGVDVLRRAGFAPVVQSYGSQGGAAAICALRDPDTGTVQGCESGSSCLTCLQPDSWGYYPGYRYSPVGAGSTNPGAGSVEAWRWGRSTSWGGSTPGAGSICGEADPEPPPATDPPTTPPPSGGGGGGGGSAVPVPGDPGPGSGGSGGSDGSGGGDGGGAGTPGPSDTPDPSDPSTTAEGSSTTAPGDATTTAPGAEGDEATTTEAGRVADGDADGPGSGGDADEQADAVSLAADGGPGGDGDDGGGGRGGGAPVVPLLVTALVVAAVAALALRARRARSGADPSSDVHAPGAPA